MFSFRNLSQLTTILQNIESLDLCSDEKSYFVKAELGRAKDGLREMKKARVILESLCTDLTAMITNVTACIMPAVLHHGLKELPDEVLADVLVRDTSNHLWPYDRYKDLNMVNQRFGSVITTTPSCWSHADTRRKSKLHEFTIIKNGHLPIDCTMDTEVDLAAFAHFKDRIRSIRWTYFKPNWMTNDTILRDESVLPSVKTLSIENHVTESNFPRNWTFPQLTSLECDGTLPNGPFPFLRHFVLNLKLYYVERACGWIIETDRNYSEIYELLRSTHSLESLSITNNGNMPSQKPRNKTKFITLPNLRRFSIRCSPDDNNDNFLGLLKCPSLETLEVDLEPFIPNHFHYSMFGAFDPNLRLNYMNVTNLTITGGTNPRGVHMDENAFPSIKEEIKICLCGLHFTFPRLKKLSIDGNLRIKINNNRNTRITSTDIEDLQTLSSVYLRVPLEKHWADLETIFAFYKKVNVDLKYVEVRDWSQDHYRRNHTLMKSLSTMFPNSRVRVDEFKQILQ